MPGVATCTAHPCPPVTYALCSHPHIGAIEEGSPPTPAHDAYTHLTHRKCTFVRSRPSASRRCHTGTHTPPRCVAGSPNYHSLGPSRTRRLGLGTTRTYAHEHGGGHWLSEDKGTGWKWQLWKRGCGRIVGWSRVSPPPLLLIPPTPTTSVPVHTIKSSAPPPLQNINTPWPRQAQEVAAEWGKQPRHTFVELIQRHQARHQEPIHLHLHVVSLQRCATEAHRLGHIAVKKRVLGVAQEVLCAHDVVAANSSPPPPPPPPPPPLPTGKFALAWARNQRALVHFKVLGDIAETEGSDARDGGGDAHLHRELGIEGCKKAA